jgi:SAM-dependent methyltransferase
MRPRPDDPALSAEWQAEKRHYERLERDWQDSVGQALLDQPHETPGSALVFCRQADRLIDRLDLTRPATLVEIGCGNGHFLRRLAARAGRGWNLIGVDVSRAVWSLPKHGLSGVQADGEQLPFRDASAAHVVYDGALHHLIDYPAALREAARVLAPGGSLLVFEPATGWFNRLLHRLLDPIVFRSATVYESPIDIHYKARFRREVIVDELRRLGMAPSQSRSDFLAYPLTGCYAGSPFARSERLMRLAIRIEDLVTAIPLLGRLALSFAWRFTVVARKPTSTI